MSPPQQLRQQTSNCSSLLIYRPRKDERLSWPSWLTYSGWVTHISGHPSATSTSDGLDVVSSSVLVSTVADPALGRRRKARARSSRSSSEASTDGIAAQCSWRPHPQPQQARSAVHEVSSAGNPAASETPGATEQGL